MTTEPQAFWPQIKIKRLFLPHAHFICNKLLKGAISAKLKIHDHVNISLTWHSRPARHVHSCLLQLRAGPDMVCKKNKLSVNPRGLNFSL